MGIFNLKSSRNMEKKDNIQPDSDSDDDIPELEDMGEKLQRLKVEEAEKKKEMAEKEKNMPQKPKPDYTRTREQEQEVKEKYQKELDKKLGQAFAKAMASDDKPKVKKTDKKDVNITKVKATE